MRPRLRLPRHPAVFLTLLAVVTFALVVAAQSFFPETASASHAGPVTLTITRVDNIGDEGIEDNLRGEADLYAYVTIDGTPFDSKGVHVDNKDHIQPFWTFSKSFSGGAPDFVSVHIEIWDHDDCDPPRCSFSPDPFGGSDDQGDVNPTPGNDSIDIVVDRTTGTWTGTTSNNCSQGDDTSNGDRRVSVCWDISTLSASGDADGDGLLDSWETNGLDFNGDGTIDVDLPTFGANPNHKDLFLELDYVNGQTPAAGAIAAMKAAFAAAPINAGGISNPDGQPGINLWVDTSGNDGGDNFGGGNSAAGAPNCMSSSFYTFKNANFNANRAWVFRYGVVGNPADSSPCGGGQGEIGGNDFIEYNHDGGTIMHEFGHTLNLHHGGDVDDNCKPNFVSVMNYDNQFGINQTGGGSIIDYSPPRFAGGRGVAPLATIKEDALNEGIVFDSTDATNQLVFVNGKGQKARAQLNGPVDWNGDGDTADNPVTVNVDTVGANGRPSRCNNGSNNSTLTGHDDWSVIALNFRPFGDSADGAINPVPDPEMTLQEMLDLQQELNTTDLKISKVDSPDPVVAGGELYYDITVTNNGPNPANSVKVTDTLPSGLVFVTSTDTCTEAPAGTLTCNLGTVAANASKTFTIKTQVPANYIAATGPVGITNSATVENVGGTDSDPSNNSASASTIVEDSADLRVTKICKPDGPLPAGQTGTCTIFVDNLGLSDARNVVLTDANLSNGAFTITGANANPGGACPVAAGVVTCNLGTEPAGGRTTITVTVTASDAVDINDCASVASDTPDPNTGNNQACESINVSAVADLQAFSVFGAEVQTNGLPGLTVNTNALPTMPDPACCNFGGTNVTAGRRIQWDTTVLNAGPSQAGNVHLEVSLPQGASLIENTLTGAPNPGGKPGRCSTAPAGAQRTKVLCDYGTLLAGEQGGVRFQVLIDPALPAGTQMSFDSIVTSDQFDPNTSNNTTSIQFDVNNWADMGLDKTESGSPVSGTDILYTYHISNSGPSFAHDVSFRDDLPAGTSFVSAYVDHEGGTGGVPLACTINQPTNQVVCPLGTIPPTGAAPIVIFVTVHIASSVPNGAALTNSADLVSDTPDPYGPGSTDSVTVNAIAIADITVTKTSDADVYKSSGTVTYKISVHNDGPSNAQGVVMTDNLPLIKQDRVIWLPGAPTCTKPAGGTLLTCNLGMIPNGGTKTVTVIVVFKGSRGWIDNTANVTTTTTDPDSGNNSSTRTVLIGTLPKP